MDEKIKSLAKGRTGATLIEVLEAVKSKVADIRTKFEGDIKGDENDIRWGVIQMLDEQLISKLKVYRNEINPGNPNEFN